MSSKLKIFKWYANYYLYEFDGKLNYDIRLWHYELRRGNAWQGQLPSVPRL